MPGFLDSVAVEIRKLRGSLTALMCLLGPLSVVAFSVLLLLNQNSGSILEAGWMRFAQGIIALWASLVFPLLVALQAASINHIDHAVDGWKRMFSLPISPARFFLAKLFVLAAVMVLTNLVLGALLLTVAGGWGALSPAVPALDYEVVAHVARSLLACVAGGALMVVLHYVLSWTFDSFVLPLTIGVVATMMIVQVGSSEYWVWHPWTWAMTASAASDPTVATRAIWLGLSTATAGAILGSHYARRFRRFG